MISTRYFTDKFAIFTSSLCIAHCLLFPVLAIIVPGFLALGLNSENFHFWMIITTIPVSLYALTIGFKKHARRPIILIGLLGLCCLLLAFFLGGSILGEIGEKALTTIGALLVSYAHIKNFKACQLQGASLAKAQ
ncbi:MerC domain-containing protein [Colwelliaceae bacterium MEBiC 14330]